MERRLRMDNNFKRAQEAYDRQEPPADKCLDRCEDLRGWIYEEQIALCITNNAPSYEDDEYWAVYNEDSTDR
jgi:hypothetical protein